MEGKLIFLWSALSNFLSGRGTFPARASPGREGPSSGLELMGSKTRDPALASPDGVLRKMWVTQSFSSAPEKEKASSPPSAAGCGAESQCGKSLPPPPRARLHKELLELPGQTQNHTLQMPGLGKGGAKRDQFHQLNSLPSPILCTQPLPVTGNLITASPAHFLHPGLELLQKTKWKLSWGAYICGASTRSSVSRASLVAKYLQFS